MNKDKISTFNVYPLQDNLNSLAGLHTPRSYLRDRKN